MFIARTRTEGPVIARWWRRLWLWLRPAEIVAEAQADTVLELSEWDVDVWEVVPQTTIRARPDSSALNPPRLPPPIPAEARARAVPVATLAAAAAPSPDLGGWDDVLARARARLVSDAASDPQHVALTPAPAFDPSLHRARLPRASARARNAERRARPPTGEVRWADLVASAQGNKPAPAPRRRRRRTSSISLACPPTDEAVPSAIDADESSSGVASGH
jgi:hypothetical protein